MLAAGLLARKARARGLTAKPWVKTSLAPGSRVVTDYFTKAGVLDDLAAIGFDLVGYGCTTCIAAGTPVLLANGTAVASRPLPAGGGAAVFASDRRAAAWRCAVQTEMMVQGERECVVLVLQDGRTLVVHAGARDPVRRWPLGARRCSSISVTRSRRHGARGAAR